MRLNSLIAHEWGNTNPAGASARINQAGSPTKDECPGLESETRDNSAVEPRRIRLMEPKSGIPHCDNSSAYGCDGSAWPVLSSTPPETGLPAIDRELVNICCGSCRRGSHAVDLEIR